MLIVKARITISIPATVAIAKIIVVQMGRKDTISFRIVGTVVLTSLLLADGCSRTVLGEVCDGTAKVKDVANVVGMVIGAEVSAVVQSMVLVDNFVRGNMLVRKVPLLYVLVRIIVTS